MDKIKQLDIKNLFKKVKLESTKPYEIDYILKKSNIDINTINKPVGNYTLFEYCILNTNNIELIDYLYKNSNRVSKGNELLLAFSHSSKRKDIKLLNWIFKNNLIISEKIGSLKSKNHIISFLLSVGLTNSKEKFKNELLKFIETNLNSFIYEKDENNNTLLHLYEFYEEDSFKWLINFIDINAINNQNETALELYLKKIQKSNFTHYSNFYLFFKYNTKLNFNILEYIIYMKHSSDCKWSCENSKKITENCCIGNYKDKIYIMTFLLEYNYIIFSNKYKDLDLSLELLSNNFLYSNRFENHITNNYITNSFDKLIEMYNMFLNFVKKKLIKDSEVIINTEKFLL